MAIQGAKPGTWQRNIMKALRKMASVRRDGADVETLGGVCGVEAEPDTTGGAVKWGNTGVRVGTACVVQVSSPDLTSCLGQELLASIWGIGWTNSALTTKSFHAVTPYLDEILSTAGVLLIS